MSRQVLIDAGNEARLCSYNGVNQLAGAMADWWLAEAEAHFHIGGDEYRYVYDMPGMDQSPAVRAAEAYLAGDDRL